MRDLDMGDVLADAARMEDDYFNRLFEDLEVLDPADLDRELYRYSIEARQGRKFSMDVVQMIGYIRLTRIQTTLCEGCLDRTGCDMCCPPDFTDYTVDQDAHYEQFGRPAFPNEY